MMFKSLKQSPESNQPTLTNNLTLSDNAKRSNPFTGAAQIIEATSRGNKTTAISAAPRLGFQLAILSLLFGTLPGQLLACEQDAGLTQHIDTQHAQPPLPIADSPADQVASTPKAAEDINAISTTLNIGRSEPTVVVYDDDVSDAVLEEEVASRGDSVNLSYFFASIGAWFQGLLAAPASTPDLSTEIHADSDATLTPPIAETTDIATEAVAIETDDTVADETLMSDSTLAETMTESDQSEALDIGTATTIAATTTTMAVTPGIIEHTTVKSEEQAPDNANAKVTSDMVSDPSAQANIIAEAPAPAATPKPTQIGSWLSTLLVVSSVTNAENTDATDATDATEIGSTAATIATVEDINELNERTPTAAGVEKPTSTEGKLAMNAKKTPSIINDLPSKEPIIPIKENTSNALNLTWALEKNWDSAHPGECRLTTSTIQLDEHGYATQVWFDVVDDKLQINTSAYIDTGMPGVGIRDTQGNLSKFEHSDYISKAIWQGNLQKTIVKSRIVKLVIGGVEIGSQPQEVLLDLTDLSKSYPAYRQCNRG